jgi:radical SAM-linked protein
LPVAHSAGFTPHPKISYAGGAPTGVASEAEYLSLALTSRHEAADVRDRLNAALPDGIDVITATEDAGGLPASRLTASRWQIVFTDLAPEDVAPAVEKFLALDHAPVERMTNKGLRRMDARAAVATLDTVLPDIADTGISNTDGQGATLEMVIHHTVPAVRPDDVLTALREVSDLTLSVPPVMMRLEQGSFGESGMVQP